MGSVFDYNQESIRQIEYLIPRLKYSLYPTKIVKWLENFEKDDVKYALDILSVIEYIPFTEFMYRLESLMKELFKKIPKHDMVIIFPYGKMGKSGTLVTYPLKNTKTFKSNENRILLTHDLKFIQNPTSFKHIIFLDDFIGSGNTFIKEFNKNDIQNFIITNNINKLYILSVIIMNEGKNKINSTFSNIEIIAEERFKLFDKLYSPFNAFTNTTLETVEKVALKYGQMIPVVPPPTSYLPLGYGQSESIISFFHGTPNNTLPIIWGNSNGWFPLFARNANTRMSEAKKMKKEITYYLDICTKLDINLSVGTKLISRRKDNRSEAKRLLREQNHATITVLFLKDRLYENIFICQILGLTTEELQYIFYELKNKGLVSADYKTITLEGRKILNKLKLLSKIEKIRNETANNLAIKNNLYLPQMFDGMT
ncbi:hypothetical protein [Myroides sp. DW712]|uniref:phosphoribosyltransferase-like protein n=1 Tax=Myroides sp. DW712 TaxID=3389800 RepID=UPI00397BA001